MTISIPSDFQVNLFYCEDRYEYESVSVILTIRKKKFRILIFPHCRQVTISILAICSSALAYNVECTYKTKTNWFPIDDVYFCQIVSNVSKCAYVINVDVTVTSVNGTHLNGKSDGDVVGFRTDGNSFNRFPNGLEKFFTAENIVFINIWKSGLKEIHEKDLAPYDNVKFISFAGNDLETIAHDLFKHNTKLETVGFPRNKIKIVDTTVFDVLPNLVKLFMNHNVCIDSEETSRSKDLFLIDEMKRNCK